MWPDRPSIGTPVGRPMPIRNLYLGIYLTVVAVLLAFALVAGLLVRSHVGGERERIESGINQRTLALGELLANSLPDAGTPVAEQAAAVQDWDRRMRVPLALDDSAGRRIAASPVFERLRDEGETTIRIPLGDGRTLWLARPPRRPDGFGRPPRPILDEAALLLTLLAALFVAVAAGSYPVVRRLTRRLEALKQGVQTFGGGDLAHRLAVDGNDEVAAVASSFNQAAQRIDDLVRANRSLLANASHELRSPLARLKMAVEMMDGTTPQRRAALKREIDQDIRELDALVEEVLLASRLDAQRELQREAVDLLGLLAEEGARVGALVDGAPVRALADERLLHRAMRNLLENARRYGGTEIEADVRLDTTGAVVLRVCDRGPGVPEAHRERVFEPFFRLPGHAEYAGGIGLGLSLVRQIAGRHGGTVRCEARAGGGSCFVLTLPADAVVS